MLYYRHWFPQVAGQLDVKPRVLRYWERETPAVDMCPMSHLGINLLIRDCKACLSGFLPLPHHHLDLQRLIVHGLPQC
jgi:hypothetical protein